VNPSPPRAPRRPQLLSAHGDERVDDWYWLRDRQDPEVLAHLRAENAYTDAALAHLAPLRERIFAEIRGRIPGTDVSAPVPHGPFEYYRRTVEGREYPVHCRRRRDGGSEEVLLDVNALASDHDYCAVGDLAVSPDHRLLAVTVDFEGNEEHDLRVLDLASGAVVATAARVYYGIAWADDAASLWFVRPDAAMRPHQVWRLSWPPLAESLVFEEPDERFFVDVRRARDGEHAVVEIASKTTSEARLLDTADPQEPPRTVVPRVEGVEYSVEPAGGDVYVVTNDGAPDFRVLRLPAGDEVLESRPGVRRLGVDAFAGHVVVTERAGGLLRLRIRQRDGQGERVIGDAERAATVHLGPAAEFDTGRVRVVSTSLLDPVTDLDVDLDTGAATVVKHDEVVGGFDASRFVSERLHATAADGTEIPITLARPAGGALDGSTPLLLYGYGSYETSIDPAFSHARLSLLERGAAFAIAHVRGGGEMGRAWYDGGKLARKPNTFTDFIACAEHLVAGGYTSPDRLVARGRSAGGLLMGAVANLRPDLFRAIVAEVPFVDALTTMQDAGLPLTVTEWEEWGDPGADAEIYAVMRAYSPYDNVRAVPYPAILATAGLHDSRVQYWEPAKWVQRLRAVTTGDRPILLRCEMGAGHAGRTGRYRAWEEEAFVLAFVVDQMGLAP
jgi:oligopeptidase B